MATKETNTYKKLDKVEKYTKEQKEKLRLARIWCKKRVEELKENKQYLSDAKIKKQQRKLKQELKEKI